ncbi:MAG: iron-sulfur cluster assembly protein [Chitinophagales bacterium]|nr:iron-sulfur cluster assembly protein [Chitinophagales bacterium]
MKNFIQIKDDAINVLKDIFDPEIPVNIYDLGLVYDVTVDPGNHIHVLMTLTSPNCPVAESLPQEVKERLEEIEDATGADVEVTFEPTWTMDNMSEEAKLELGML